MLFERILLVFLMSTMKYFSAIYNHKGSIAFLNGLIYVHL